MRVARWGNSLAVRLPAAVVEKLGVSEGDEITLIADSTAAVRVARDFRVEEALAALLAMRVPLPPDYRFDRDEANARTASE